nr:MAG TPA: hypothetical protein [Caudoviricetes sp.]
MPDIGKLVVIKIMLTQLLLEIWLAIYRVR